MDIIQHEVEFLVVRVSPANGGLTLDGRCCRGTVALGQVFSVLSQVDLRQIPDGFSGPSSLKPVGSLCLRVESILLYGGLSDFLSQGVTARLELTGTGGRANRAENGSEHSQNSGHEPSIVHSSNREVF